jgi:hypothetical protein
MLLQKVIVREPILIILKSIEYLRKVIIATFIYDDENYALVLNKRQIIPEA